MGLLKNKYELNLNTTKIYNFNTLKDDIPKADYEIMDESDIFFKPISNGQIENN